MQRVEARPFYHMSETQQLRSTYYGAVSSMVVVVGSNSVWTELQKAKESRETQRRAYAPLWVVTTE